ncbi:condensation domain-containing protein, partial [Variovorax sp. DT-64]|uniref:condensation domain-containing protein n=1 Tax=Variovorax sp. DT-64 TaxID=3396160 RepID=UPI003F1945F8
LARIWCEVLGVERVGRHDNFFELGGHSLLAAQLLSRIQKLADRSIPLALVFQRPLLHQLAQSLHATAPSKRARASFPPAATGLRAPMSYAQQRLWFLWNLDPSAATFNVSASFWLRGPLDLQALESACHDLVARHAVLRTVFSEEDGQGWQQVEALPDPPAPLIEHIALADAHEDANGVRLRERVAVLARQPFDLVRGPLLRIRLIQLDAQAHLMLVSMHHIVTDGWSMKLLISDFVRLYAARRNGLESGLPALAIGYADFAIGQRRWLEDGEMARQLAYWTARIAGVPALRLAPDKAPPPVRSHPCGVLRFPLAGAGTAQLRTFAQRHAASPFMVLLAAFSVAMAERTGEARFLVGTDMANRNHQETEDLVGFFVNQAALVIDCAAPDSFAGLLAQLQRTVAEAADHQDMPFDRLVDAVRAGRRGSGGGRAPLFQVKVIHQDQTAPPLSLPGLQIEEYPLEAAEAEIDLLVGFVLESGHPGLAIKYDRELFEDASIAGIGREIAAVLGAGLADPAISIEQLRALARGERQASQQLQARDRLRQLAHARAGLRSRTAASPAN